MINVVTSNPLNLPDIAKCHNECFKNSLSSRLGTAYTKKTFEWFLAGKNRFLFHAVKNSEVIGYCGGFIPQYEGDGSTSGMMQYAMSQAILGVVIHPWVLFSKEVIAMYPLIFKNIKRKISGNNNTEKVQAVKPFDLRAGLVVIGVKPEHRGSGVFQTLMHEFEVRVRGYAISKLTLSVKKNNARAINAYTKQGWFITKEHEHTLEMCKYIE
ncbi:MAG TPA: GNAT family N-acetyltransferase [Chitinophagaceae bacterium]|nr:GNAT family N-acetyltransferase [Chitinophagaceae bacterium]